MFVSRVKAEEAASVLGVTLADLDEAALRKAYHAKAKDCHPDHHGADKLPMWSRISWANECLGHWLKHNPLEEAALPEDLPKDKCRACMGTGRVDVRKMRGFNKPLTMMCVMCNGMGERVEKEDDGD